MGRRTRAIDPGVALLPLRLFLGATFVYAGIQKLSDPGFLHPGAPTYIGTQLTSFASGTPGGFLLQTFAIPHPELAGVGVAVFEIAVGLCALSGLLTRYAAAAGLMLNLVLFLTASWHTTPYFLGPDIVFVFAWLPFVLAGAEGQPALDHVIRRGSPALARRARLNPDAGQLTPAESSTLTRRTLLAGAGAATLGIAGVASLARGAYTGQIAAANSSASGRSGPSRQSESTQASAKPSTSTPQAPSVPSDAVKIGPSSRLPAGQAAVYRDPSTQQPDIVIRASDGSLAAFSAVCTHAGCTVGYESGELVCPCHGGTYDASTGQVTGGPPPAPLARRKVVESRGSIYAVPS